MAIIGLTDRPAAFPEIGVLRKGAPKPEKGNKPGEDLKYFRFDSADADAARLFTEHYGAEPVAIRVFVPLATAGENFEAWREEWTASSLKHRCDGQTMVRWLTPRGTYSDEPKPCTGGCKQVGRLKVVIPELRRFAYVTVLTTSIHDILQIHANLLALESLRGDLRGIPLILKRVPRKISTPNGNGERARREKWLITIEAAPSWVELQLTAQEQAALPQAQPLALPEWDGEDDEDGDASASPALADAKTAAAIETLWSQFGVKTTDKKAIYPLKSYLQEKKGVSSPSEMLAEDAKLLLGWLQGKALAVSDAQPVHQAEVVEERETVTV